MASAANSSLKNGSEPTAVFGESEDVSVGTLTPPPPHVGSVYDCELTLNDQQVLEFCRNGYMILEGVVEDAVNRRMMAFVEAHPEHQPLQVLSEDWFVDGVIKNQQAAGLYAHYWVRTSNFPRHCVITVPSALPQHKVGIETADQSTRRGSIISKFSTTLRIHRRSRDRPT